MKNNEFFSEAENSPGDAIARLHTIAGGRKKAFAGIARYILRNYKKIPDMTLCDLARETGTSTATVSRFSVYAGYRNFRAFRLNMAASALMESSSVSDIFSGNDTPRTILRRVFELNRTSLSGTESLIDIKTAVSVAKLIIKSRRVIFFGVGSSGLVGRLGAIRFQGLGISSVGTTDQYEGLLLLSSLDRRDLVIGISHSGRSRATLDLLGFASRRGAYTVSITNYSDSPLAKLSEKSLLTVFRERKINAAVSYSGIAQICVIDALYFLAAHFQGGAFESMAGQVEDNAENLLRMPKGSG